MMPKRHAATPTTYPGNPLPSWYPYPLPAGDALLFVCWEHQSDLASANFPQRLGVVYCFNRPCSLRALAWPQPAGEAAAGRELSVPLAGSLASAFSPRFSPDGSTLVFLSQQNAIASGVHNATCTLHSLRWADAKAGLTGGAVPPPKTGGLPCCAAVGWVALLPYSCCHIAAVGWVALLPHSSSCCHMP